MTKPKFYAVRKGLRPGIYTTWAECQEQTKGVSGAAFKSFSTQQAADQYLEAGVELLAKKRTRRQSSSLHSSQQEATPDSLGPINSEPEGTSKTPAQANTGVPEWIEPDKMYKLEFDGASRGNPGPAGAGAALSKSTDGSQVGSICLNLGIMTNNQAEYYGLLAGLEACKAVGVKRITVRGDSQLVIRQVQGLYKVNNVALQDLHSRVKHVLGSFQEFHMKHVLRSHNKIADELSNRAIDTPGWHGLKDLQGRLWGYTEVCQGSRTAINVGGEPVSKKVYEVPTSLWKCSRSLPCHTYCSSNCSQARWQGQSHSFQLGGSQYQQPCCLWHNRHMLGHISLRRYQTAALQPQYSARPAGQRVSLRSVQTLAAGLRRCCRI